MKTPSLQRTHAMRTLLLLALALSSASALAIDKSVLASAIARHQADRAECMGSNPSQPRELCLRSADTSLAMAKRGEVDDPQTPYAANALRRCQPLSEEDRRDCIARMQGQGTTSGSVKAGGIYRELVTREVAAPSPDKPASSALEAPRQ